MRALLALFAVAAVAAVGACGGPDIEERQRQAQEAIERYGAAVKAGRNEEICNELFAPQLRDEIAMSGDCVEALGAAPEGEYGITVNEVRVDGANATADVTVRGLTGPPITGVQEAQGQIRLTEQDGRWLISEIG